MEAGDVPGSPVVKTPALPLQEVWVQSLIGELRSCGPCSMAKKKPFSLPSKRLPLTQSFTIKQKQFPNFQEKQSKQNDNIQQPHTSYSSANPQLESACCFLKQASKFSTLINLDLGKKQRVRIGCIQSSSHSRQKHASYFLKSKMCTHFLGLHRRKAKGKKKRQLEKTKNDSTITPEIFPQRRKPIVQWQGVVGGGSL